MKVVTLTLVFSAGLSSLAATTTMASSAPTVTPDISTNLDAVNYSSNADNVPQSPLQMDSMAPSESPRHGQEKAHLMKRLSRKHGTWNAMHPRYRLLEGLYGFSKYRERNMAELRKWRSQYNSVSKAQKKVLYRTFSQDYINESRRWRKQSTTRKNCTTLNSQSTRTRSCATPSSHTPWRFTQLARKN